jgi:hypothetical protein
VTTTEDDLTKMSIINQLATVFSFSTGIFLTLIRFYEPYFRFLAKKQIWEWFGLYADENDEVNKKKFKNDALSTFLRMSLNIELVNIIL